MDYYLSLKRNEVLVYPATWMNLENSLHERGQSQKMIPFIPFMSRREKSRKTERIFVVA